MKLVELARLVVSILDNFFCWYYFVRFSREKKMSVVWRDGVVRFWECLGCGMISRNVFVCHCPKRLKGVAYSWSGFEWQRSE